MTLSETFVPWRVVQANDGDSADPAGMCQLFRVVDHEDQFFGGFDIRENLEPDAEYLNMVEQRWIALEKRYIEAVRLLTKTVSIIPTTGWSNQLDLSGEIVAFLGPVKS